MLAGQEQSYGGYQRAYPEHLPPPPSHSMAAGSLGGGLGGGTPFSVRDILAEHCAQEQFSYQHYDQHYDHTAPEYYSCNLSGGGLQYDPYLYDDQPLADPLVEPRARADPLTCTPSPSSTGSTCSLAMAPGRSAVSTVKNKSDRRRNYLSPPI